MTVPGINAFSASSAAYTRLVTSVPAEPAVWPGQELPRTQDWPLSSYLELRAVPTSVRSARQHVKKVLSTWQLGDLAETAELLVSEIITNAVRATASVLPQLRGTGQPAQIRFWLASDRRGVLIQVWDADDRRPARQDPGLDAEAGRGLLLVETLSARWGCYTPEGHDGKTVWAVVLSLRQAPALVRAIIAGVDD
jgi:anti-sigma regulatory factor (Ser/Thr protein kinase)